MNEFQDRTRLDRAIWYMKVTPDVKMSALALELGYDRLSEFSRFFRNKTGMSPRGYLDELIKRGSG
jgi:AraC-like DNA-binding protein